MHMSDALVSTPVAAAAAITAAALIVTAVRKIKTDTREDIIPVMGVCGAFVFAAQMINFTIPGTGSSGHIVGGVLAAALLGPWAGFLVICSVLIIQCLVFADGGLLALGCNIINMGAMSCLVAWPLIYRPFVRFPSSVARLSAVSVMTCVIGLELGAVLVTAETELSGITALPWAQFFLFMTPIHLAIGIGEGLATAALLSFVYSYKPDLLYRWHGHESAGQRHHRRKTVVVIFALLAVLLAGSAMWIASGLPDGLEWSLAKMGAPESLTESAALPTSVMPDYDSVFAGLIGGVIVLAVLWGVLSVIFMRRRSSR